MTKDIKANQWLNQDAPVVAPVSQNVINQRTMDVAFRKHRAIWVITAALSIWLGYKAFTYSTESSGADDYWL